MEVQKRRNRKRSKRRAIYCPIHGCYIDSVSQKHRLYADKAEHLRSRGMSRKASVRVMASYTTVPLAGEWLEAFWCQECQRNEWYWVTQSKARTYELSTIPEDLWQQAQGVILSGGNPTVSEFTRRQSRQISYQGIRDFAIIR
jgi:organic radical activating enzyme